MKRWSLALFCLMLLGLAGALLFSSGLQGQPSSPVVFPKELTSYRDVVKSVLPAVVSIKSLPKATAKRERSTQPRRRQRFGIEEFPGIPEEFRKFFEGLEEPNIEPEDLVPQQSFGSGFIIDPKGVVLTNFHVVDGADRVEVTLKDGRTFKSTEIKGDRKNDLAIVRIHASGSPLPYLQLGDSDAMEIGDRVLAVGAPFGLAGSVTAGIVSAKGREGLSPGHAVYEDYLQTDAAINPGNSGGPLVNLEGKVIGINTAIRTRTGGFQGVGLAITSNVAKNIVNQLTREGVVHRGYLGIAFEPLKPEVAEDLGLKDQKGFVVTQVSKNSPASKAGIKPLDVIVAVSGKSFKEGRELQRLVSSLPLHKSVDITVVRDGKTLILPVTIEEQPEDYGVTTLQRRGRSTPSEEDEDITVDKFGFDVADLTPDMAKSLGYRSTTEGVAVTDVQPGSVADEAGLRRGVVITKINRKPVTSAKEVRNMLEKAPSGKSILLQVQYPERLGGGSHYITLKPEPVEK